MSGLVADSRTLVDHARVECANHWFVYNADMKVESVAQAVSNLAIRFGDSDDDGPAMVSACVCLFYLLLHFFHCFVYEGLLVQAYVCVCVRVAKGLKRKVELLIIGRCVLGVY